MTAEELRRMIAWLEKRVALSEPGSREVRFEPPVEDELVAAGFEVDAVRRFLAAPWFDEMVGDVRETPEFADPSDPPEQVLRYARDVIGEYIRKRFVI